MGGEVRKDQVDSGLFLLGEEDAAVDDEQSALVFEDRHVAADLAETAERGDAQAALRELRRGAEFGMRMTQKTLLTTHATYRWGTWRACHSCTCCCLCWPRMAALFLLIQL